MERYLDDYFSSLTKQILDFQKHIQLILVDDGSTDDSATIMKKWQKRYPGNISYIYKEHSGRGAARNVRIPLVKIPWMTFIEPHDFVDITYFSYVDNFLCKHHEVNSSEKAIKMLSCNLVYYLEKTNSYRDGHPSRFHFQHKKTLLAHDQIGKHIQLNAAVTFFSTDEIKAQQLLFTKQHCPACEDANLMLCYLQNLTGGRVSFARLPRYYHRECLTGNAEHNVMFGYDDLPPFSCG